uniref:Methyltransferase n=2 Tax=Anthurium amnicola TaxID=1678845 RepID=A0A1D1ZKE9_9ARAE
MFRANLSLLPSPNRRTLAKLFLLSILCILSYLLGMYQNSRPRVPSHVSTQENSCIQPNITARVSPSAGAAAPPLDFEPRHSAASALPPVPDADELPPVGFCDLNFTDYCPCQDPTRERRFITQNLVHRERHCPGVDERVRCRVPRPDGYRTPVRWPESRDYIWFANVPSKRLTEAKKDQHWVRVEGDRLVFPGGGTSFPGGVEGYVAGMAKVVPLKTGEVRTVLDIGCGVASFGGYLLDFKILTMSVAPRDVHEAQVQFALERGLPAMLGVLSTHRLPYPSRSFDMAHCARCLVPWTDHDGLYLLEIDRLLRPGGYWVLSGPPINWKNMYKGWRRKPQDLQAEQTALEDLAKRLCWKKIAEKGAIAVWRKPTNHIHCTKKSMILKSAPFCEGIDPDAAWYQKMDTCITSLPKAETIEEVAGGALEKWPKRLTSIPPRVTSGSIKGISADTFNHDKQVWSKRVSHYSAYINLGLSGRYRNIMDMNAGLGGFAAALSNYPVWVMNVVPSDSKNNTLGVIYEKGLIGTYMDWCEAFSTYPRTYDLVHAAGLFSMYMNRCDIMDILLEIDRILRPEGAVILRDHVDIIVQAKRAADRLRWQSRIVHSELGPFHPEKLLIVDNSVELNSDRAARK